MATQGKKLWRTAQAVLTINALRVSLAPVTKAKNTFALAHLAEDGLSTILVVLAGLSVCLLVCTKEWAWWNLNVAESQGGSHDSWGLVNILRAAQSGIVFLIIFCLYMLYTVQWRLISMNQKLLKDDYTWRSTHRLSFLVEVMLYIWHDPPFVDVDVRMSIPGLDTPVTVRNPWGYLGVLRVLLVFRIAKRLLGFETRQIVDVFARKGLSTLTFVRSSFESRPIPILVLLIFVLGLSFSYVLYGCEREFSDELGSFQDCSWVIAMSMSLVGFGELTPLTVCGRVTLAAASVSGVVLTSLITTSFHEAKAFKPHEGRIMQIFQRNIRWDGYRQAAAVVIQRSYRHHALRCRLQDGAITPGRIYAMNQRGVQGKSSPPDSMEVLNSISTELAAKHASRVRKVPSVSLFSDVAHAPTVAKHKIRGVEYRQRDADRAARAATFHYSVPQGQKHGYFARARLYYSTWQLSTAIHHFHEVREEMEAPDMNHEDHNLQFAYNIHSRFNWFWLSRFQKDGDVEQLADAVEELDTATQPTPWAPVSMPLREPSSKDTEEEDITEHVPPDLHAPRFASYSDSLAAPLQLQVSEPDLLQAEAELSDFIRERFAAMRQRVHMLEEKMLQVCAKLEEKVGIQDIAPKAQIN